MHNFMKKGTKKLISILVLFILFLYVSAFICLIPKDYTIKFMDGRLVPTYPMNMLIKYTNENMKLVLIKNTSDYITSTMQGISQSDKTMETIANSFRRTLGLLSISTVLSILIGVFKGILDSRKGKKKNANFKLLSTILPISLPDVLVIAILQSFAVWLIHHGIYIFKVGGVGSVKHMLLPIITLSILPACYIARVTAVSIDNCYEMDYIKTAQGKGCSPMRILWNHVMRNAAPIIIDDLPNITSIIISNMILVESIFSYSGLTNALKSLRGRSQGTVLIIILLIGILYFALNSVFKLMKNLFVRPIKEESV